MAGSTVCAANQALTSGVYGASLGAGGATGAERMAFGQNPAAYRPPGSGTARAGFELGFHRPFGMEELQVAEAGIFCDLPRGGVGLAWRETGSKGLYRETALAVNPSFRWGLSRSGFPGNFDLGGAWTWWRLEFPGDNQAVSGWSQGFGMVWSILPRFKAGAFATGLAAPGSGPGFTEKVWQLGFEASNRDPDVAVKSGIGQILRIDFRKAGNAPWRSLAALTVIPHPAWQVTAGLGTPPFQVSGGLHFAWGGLQCHQSLRYHRYLGKTSLTGLAYARNLAD
jgi:hypothetical protein